MKLKPSPKKFYNYKCASPEDTIKKIQKGFQQIGIQTKYMERKVKSDIYTSYIGILRIVGAGYLSYGKGFSPKLAKASAYAEMAERFSGGLLLFPAFDSVDKINSYYLLIKDVLERRFLKGYTTNFGSNIVSLNEVNKYFKEQITKEQYEIIINQRVLDTVVDCYSFDKEEYIQVPIKLIEILSDTHGLASGNTIEEALVQATCEIFERYVAYKVLSEKIKCSTIDKESIYDDKIKNYIKMFKSMNIEVIIKDLTLNNNFPVIGVLFINHNIDNDKNNLKIDRYYKKIVAASHPNLKEAILKCFMEYMQIEEYPEELMYGRIADELYDFWTKKMKKTYKKPSHPLKYFFMYYDYYEDLSFLESGKKINFNELKSYNYTDSLEDFKAVSKVCNKQKWDLQAIDFTHKKLQFPTVRVIIPPISTSFNPFITGGILKGFEERYNYFYQIKDLYRYVTSDDWLNDEKSIINLIQNLENYLSHYLFFYHIWLIRGPFQQFINIFQVLAFCYLSIGRYKKALEYFKLLSKLEDKPDFYSEFSDIIFNYNPAHFSVYISMIEKMIKEKKEIPKFRFKSNPFKREKIGLEHADYLLTILLKNINDSFFE